MRIIAYDFLSCPKEQSYLSSTNSFLVQREPTDVMIAAWRSKGPRRNLIWEIYVDREIIRLLKDREEEVSKRGSSRIQKAPPPLSSRVSSFLFSRAAKKRVRGDDERTVVGIARLPFHPFRKRVPPWMAQLEREKEFSGRESLERPPSLPPPTLCFLTHERRIQPLLHEKRKTKGKKKAIPEALQVLQSYACIVLVAVAIVIVVLLVGCITFLWTTLWACIRVPGCEEKSRGKEPLSLSLSPRYNGGFDTRP